MALPKPDYALNSHLDTGVDRGPGLAGNRRTDLDFKLRLAPTDLTHDSLDLLRGPLGGAPRLVRDCLGRHRTACGLVRSLPRQLLAFGRPRPLGHQ